MKLRAFSVGYIESSLRPRWRAFLFLLASALASLLIGILSIRVGIATTLGESTRLPELRRAVALDPANPELQRRLGLAYFYQGEELDPAQGLEHLRRAIQLNPYKPYYWADLSWACESMRDVACADEGLERSLYLSPMAPRLQWIAANYYLRANRLDAAMARFQRLLELSSQYASPTFSLCLRALKDPDLIFRKVLPPSSDLALNLQYTAFLATHGQVDFAHRVWVETVARAPRFPFPLADPYLERLIDLGRYGEAFAVWEDLERRGIIVRPDPERPEDLVFNGSFEQAVLNAGFDWRYTATPYLSLDFSDAGAYRGARCLRLDFNARRNEDYEPVSQIIPVVPGQTYIVTAYTRSEDISSDSGPRLRVLDPNCPSCLNLSSEATVGTTPWHLVALKFSPGGQTRFVRLSIWRPRSRTFPTEITGTFWLDGVSLVKSPISNTRSKT